MAVDCQYLISDRVLNANNTDTGEITNYVVLVVPVWLRRHFRLIHAMCFTCAQTSIMLENYTDPVSTYCVCLTF